MLPDRRDGPIEGFVYRFQLQKISAGNGKLLEVLKVLPLQIPRIQDDNSTVLTGIDGIDDF